jgi:hypothetical protein
MSVLSWQAADAFDAAGVLCSLLLGAGYNAFVVMGYAPLAVTLNDQSSTEYVLPAGDPLLSAADAAVAVAAASSQKQQQGQGQSAAAGSSSAGRTGGAGTAAAAAGSSGPGSAAASGAGSSSSSSNSKGGASAAGDGAAGDDLGKKKKYVVRPKPQLASKYLQEHGDPALQSEAGDTAAASTAEVRHFPSPATSCLELQHEPLSETSTV